MPRSVTRKDRQEVAFHSKQKYEERENGLATGDGWVEREGCRGREQREKRIDIDRRNGRKKNQANWYAAHNNRRVERRGSEVRPARGSCFWREGGINTLSLFLAFSRFFSYTPARTRERARRVVDTRARTCTRFPRRCSPAFLISLPSLLHRSSPRSSPWQIPKHT